MKQGETLALNERIMLSLVSTGHDCPFIVCMTYAFHTPDKLCFILDLMNGGDLHYHLSQVCMLPLEFSNCVYGGSVIWRTLAANLCVSVIPVTSDSQQVFNVLVHNHFYVRDKVICFLLKGDGESNFYFFAFLSRSIR